METLTNNINGSQGSFFDKNKVELQRIFRTCHAYIRAIHDSGLTDDDKGHIDRVDQTLQWINAQSTISRDSTHRSIFLLLQMLSNIYEVLLHYVESSQVPLNTNSSEIISHGQVHVFIESMVAQLLLNEDDTQSLEKYLHDIERRIGQANENGTPLERVLIGAEIWTDQLAALALIMYPRYVDKLKDSVLMALERIRHVLWDKNP
jgi:hypothetical protein